MKKGLRLAREKVEKVILTLHSSDFRATPFKTRKDMRMDGPNSTEIFFGGHRKKDSEKRDGKRMTKENFSEKNPTETSDFLSGALRSRFLFQFFLQPL